MTDGPIADTKFKMPEAFKKLLASVVGKNPKGKALDADGRFFPDPTPVAPPIGYVAEESMFDRMRALVKRELSAQAAEQGFESFEEADDYEVGDDFEPFSEYELILEQAQPDGPVSNPDPDQAPAKPAPGVQGAEPPAEAPGEAGGGPPAAPAAGSRQPTGGR